MASNRLSLALELGSEDAAVQSDDVAADLGRQAQASGGS